MQVLRVRVTKRNKQFVDCDWVLEDALDSYKEFMQSHFNKPLNFEVYGMNTETAEHGGGMLLAYTLKGFDSNVRVK